MFIRRTILFIICFQIFDILSEKFFSNGKKIKSADIVYSIKRHLKNPKSQSSNFLSDISEVTALNDNSISIKLVRNNPSIIKALSRDQLGIIPNGWIFDPNSKEPYVGSGQYRAIKKDNEWYLIENVNSRKSLSEKNIKSFKLILYKDNNFSIPDLLPDILPDISRRAIIEMENKFSKLYSEYKQIERISFTQTSFWIYPSSELFHNKSKREFVASILDKAVIAYAKELNLTLATGMIPVGISGSISERFKTPEKKINAKISINISYLPGVFKDFFSNKIVLEIFKNNKIDVKLNEFNPMNMDKLKLQNPDIVTGSWAGGFNDPAGFMGLLSPLLGLNFEEYLKSINLELRFCNQELDWNKRAKCFRDLNFNLCESGLLVPGWKSNAYFIARNGIYEDVEQLRYTSRFSNFKVQK